MTAIEILNYVKSAGILLAARGDRLHVEAPAGAVTPAVREALTRHKAALLSLLAPSRTYVTLRPDRVTGFAPTLPIEAVALALALEGRGFHQTVDAAGVFTVEPGADLTASDRAAIARWRPHLTALAVYEPPEVS